MLSNDNAFLWTGAIYQITCCLNEVECKRESNRWDLERAMRQKNSFKLEQEGGQTSKENFTEKREECVC